jgi:hypothetical protein
MILSYVYITPSMTLQQKDPLFCTKNSASAQPPQASTGGSTNAP